MRVAIRTPAGELIWLHRAVLTPTEVIGWAWDSLLGCEIVLAFPRRCIA